METRAGLSWGIAVQVNGEDLQTGLALSYTPVPPFLIAIPPDLSGLPGNKSTRAFFGYPPPWHHAFQICRQRCPQPRRKEASCCLGKGRALALCAEVA